MKFCSQCNSRVEICDSAACIKLAAVLMQNKLRHFILCSECISFAFETKCDLKNISRVVQCDIYKMFRYGIRAERSKHFHYPCYKKQLVWYNLLHYGINYGCGRIGTGNTFNNSARFKVVINLST